jgi:hypothetical protein
MYKGVEQFAEQQYVDRWKPGLGTFSHRIGTVYSTKHVYHCDTCGHQYAFHEAAHEPFYCHTSRCQGVQLVSIT